MSDSPLALERIVTYAHPLLFIVPNAFSFDIFRFRLYPSLRERRQKSVFFDDPLEGTETKKGAWIPLFSLYRVLFFP